MFRLAKKLIPLTLLVLAAVSATAFADDSQKVNRNNIKSTETPNSGVGELLVNINQSLDQIYASMKNIKMNGDPTISITGPKGFNGVGGSFSISF